jgi:hypothetical protein
MARPTAVEETESWAKGVVVPIPTRPASVILILSNLETTVLPFGVVAKVK